MESNNTKEYILCSAIWFDDGKEYEHPPKNIKTGLVVCGRRHHNCFNIVYHLVGAKNIRHYEKEIQGFLTNTNRFVTREEAAIIALKAGQITEPTNRLFSEDLW